MVSVIVFEKESMWFLYLYLKRNICTGRCCPQYQIHLATSLTTLTGKDTFTERKENRETMLLILKGNSDHIAHVYMT